MPSSLQAEDREFDCLTRNVYYEARGEPFRGKVAVALVTLNRVDNPKYPKTICGVVYQKNQFSWTHLKPKVKLDAALWQQAKEAALQAYMDRDILGVFKATHFHNKEVRPGWNLHKVARIGNHTFYM